MASTTRRIRRSICRDLGGVRALRTRWSRYRFKHEIRACLGSLVGRPGQATRELAPWGPEQIAGKGPYPRHA